MRPTQRRLAGLSGSRCRSRSRAHESMDKDEEYEWLAHLFCSGMVALDSPYLAAAAPPKTKKNNRKRTTDKERLLRPASGELARESHEQ